MPEIQLPDRTLQADEGANLLDCLLENGIALPWSCRAGHCQSCLVQSLDGRIPEAAHAQLSVEQRQSGWLLACQCRIDSAMQIKPYDPSRDGMTARIVSLSHLSGDVLILRLKPERPVRFKAGQHMLLWLANGLCRPYSIASLPSESELAFHVRLHPAGQFSAAIAACQVGDRLSLSPASGHMHYDPDWQDKPLLLLASGTGLAPLQAIARQALLEGNGQPMQIWHWSHGSAESYWGDHLQALKLGSPQLDVHLGDRANLAADLAHLRLVSRRTQALVCGSSAFIEQVRKRLFMAGLAARQIVDEAFVNRRP